MVIWLITGCSGGLGRGIAEAALKHGEYVAVTARRPETLQELTEKYPECALPLRLDLNDRESMKQAVEYEQAGGGFYYVGSIHESLPHALELSRMGYNGFALVYRTQPVQQTGSAYLCLCRRQRRDRRLARDEEKTGMSEDIRHRYRVSYVSRAQARFRAGYRNGGGRLDQ